MTSKLKYFLSSFLLFSFLFHPTFAETNTSKTEGDEKEEPHFRRRIHQLSKKEDPEANIKAEIKFGRNLAARVLGKYKLIKNQKLSEYITLLGTGIAAQVGRPELTYRFGVLDAPDVNAYACPGGYIFLTLGSIKLMTNEAQLVGVLAHEIAHINLKHVVNQLKIKGEDSSIASGMASLIGGSSGSLTAVFGKLMDQGYNLLFEKGLEKQDELDSDVEAINTLLALGYDWKSYRTYIAKLRTVMKSDKGSVISKTHPPAFSRVKHMEKQVRKLGARTIRGKKNKKRFNEYLEKNT